MLFESLCSAAAKRVFFHYLFCFIVNSREHTKLCRSIFFILPGGGCQGDEQSLKNASDVDNRAFLGNEEVHGWEDK